MNFVKASSSGRGISRISVPSILFISSFAFQHHLPGNPAIEEQCQTDGEDIRHRLRSHKAGDANGRLQNEQGWNEDDPLTAQIDNQGGSGGSHGLQRVNHHIEYAEQRACGQQDAGELHRIGVGICVRQERPHDLIDKPEHRLPEHRRILDPSA